MLVLPAVFVLGPAGHDGAALIGAGVADGAVDEVDAVEEVDHMDSHPVVEVLAVGQLHGLLQVQPGIQRRLGLLVQLEALRPGLKLALGSECPIFVEDLFQSQGHGSMWWQRLVICLNASGELFTVESQKGCVNKQSSFRSGLSVGVCLDSACNCVNLQRIREERQRDSLVNGCSFPYDYMVC